MDGYVDTHAEPAGIVAERGQLLQVGGSAQRRVRPPPTRRQGRHRLAQARHSQPLHKELHMDAALQQSQPDLVANPGVGVRGG